VREIRKTERTAGQCRDARKDPPSTHVKHGFSSVCGEPAKGSTRDTESRSRPLACEHKHTNAEAALNHRSILRVTACPVALTVVAVAQRKKRRFPRERTKPGCDCGLGGPGYLAHTGQLHINTCAVGEQLSVHKPSRPYVKFHNFGSPMIQQSSTQHALHL
jgi:hypothetical protein